MSCLAYFGVYSIDSISINVVIGRNEAPRTRGKYLIDPEYSGLSVPYQ